jgi:hypothetical protein
MGSSGPLNSCTSFACTHNVHGAQWVLKRTTWGCGMQKKARVAADRVHQQYQHQHLTAYTSAAPQQVSAAAPQPQNLENAARQAYYPTQQAQQPQPQSDQHAAAWAAYYAQQARQKAAAVTPAPSLAPPMQSMLPPQQLPLPPPQQQQHVPSSLPPQPFHSGGAPPHSMPRVQHGVSPQQYNVNVQLPTHYAMGQPLPQGLSMPPQDSPMIVVGTKRPYGH